MPMKKNYYKEKNKQNYEINKKISDEYKHDSNFGKSFTQFKRERKKQMGC